jgi:hypothetical protein
MVDLRLDPSDGTSPYRTVAPQDARAMNHPD